MKRTQRPYVICHMVPSVDGRIVTANWKGLIDELSVLVAPIADGSIGTPSLFDAREAKGPARHLKLVSFEKRRGDLLWLRYKLKR